MVHVWSFTKYLVSYLVLVGIVHGGSCSYIDAREYVWDVHYSLMFLFSGIIRYSSCTCKDAWQAWRCHHPCLICLLWSNLPCFQASSEVARVSTKMPGRPGSATTRVWDAYCGLIFLVFRHHPGQLMYIQRCLAGLGVPRLGLPDAHRGEYGWGLGDTASVPSGHHGGWLHWLDQRPHGPWLVCRLYMPETDVYLPHYCRHRSVGRLWVLSINHRWQWVINPSPSWYNQLWKSIN